MSHVPAGAGAPLVSIVIPTYARAAKLRACLDGVRRLRFDPARYEVIVVDDGSPEPLEAIAGDYRDALAIDVVRQPRSGPGAARNAGVAVARGRFLAFLDDDCTPSPDWLAVLVRELERDERRLLGGRVVNALSGNAYSVASESISEFVYDYNRTPAARERFFTSNNIAVAASLFRELGGFSSSIPAGTAEDKEFCDRWRARGLPLAHVPDAVVMHAHDLTFRRFLRQHFRYGRGILAFRLMRRARARANGVGRAIIPESLGFYARLVASPLRRRDRPRRWRSALLLVLAQAATISGAAWQLLRWPLDRRAALASNESA